MAADLKITELSAITHSTLSGSDLLPVVDVSNTTMALSGTDYNITLDEFVAYVLANLGQNTQYVLGVQIFT